MSAGANIKTLLMAILLVILAPPAGHAGTIAQYTLLNPLLNASSTASSSQQLLVQNSGLVPTDTTPFQVMPERSAFDTPLKFRIFQKLPSRFWFSCVTEENGRWETNVYQTSSPGREDFVFRSLPNITAGWALSEHTNIYSNYFVIKDIYAAQGSLDSPTTMSLSMGLRRDFPIGKKTVIQFDTQARELWESARLNQADLMPAINLTRAITPHILFFSSILLQMRSHYLFEGPTREFDPFYNMGLVMSYKDWTFVITDTYVTNFRDPPFRNSVPPQGNVSMVADFEISHPISKRLQSLTAFIRAEPIWNWRSHYVPGQSGIDFRLYSGLRITINKPAFNGEINQLRATLRKSAQLMNQYSQNNTTPP